jgi:hypothetical protein
MKGLSKNEEFKMIRKCNMPDHRGGTIRSRFYKIYLPDRKDKCEYIPSRLLHTRGWDSGH